MFWGCLLKNNVLFVKWVFLNLLCIFSSVLGLFIKKYCPFCQMNISQFAVYIFWYCLFKSYVFLVKWIFLNLLYIFSSVLVLFIQTLCHFMVGIHFIQKLCLFSQMNISEFAVYIFKCPGTLFKTYVILVKWILLNLLCTFSGIVYEEVISVHWPSKFYDQPHS